MASLCDIGYRKSSDLKELANKYGVIQCKENNEILIRFFGPPGSFYEGGAWNVLIRIPEWYPYEPPTVIFKNPIFHPNICEESGHVCVDVLKSGWSFGYDLVDIVQVFLPSLLMDPNVTDTLNPFAAGKFICGPEEYKEAVIQHTKRHASVSI